MSSLLSQHTLQPQVRDLLQSMLAAGRVSHAYLFVGPAGSGKVDLAYAFAQGIACSDAGCGSCIDCKKVELRNHPDIHLVAPEGAGGYLIEQIRAVVSDAVLAPIQAKKKVYILTDVDRFGVSAANAFLKTLEEPSDSVVLILLTTRVESVLPTILSRCQVVQFRSVPEADAVAEVLCRVEATPQMARIAVNTCHGALDLACDFCRMDDLRDVRTEALAVLKKLSRMDDWQVLKAAEALCAGGENLLEELKERQDEEALVASDFLTKGALKQLEQKHKRQQTAKSRQLFHLRCSFIESWLRDVLLIKAGKSDLLVNEDAREALLAAAESVTETAVLCACDAVTRARRAIDYNVSLQLCLETLLLDIREDLYGPHYTC